LADNVPTFTAESLRTMSTDFFQAAGFPREEAAIIGRLLVEANLTGHDTHGVRHLSPYLERIRRGEIAAGAPVTLIRETATTALLDGHRTLGHVAATRAVELAVRKARKSRIAAVAVRDLEHVGRVGAYPEMAAREGLVCIAFVNAQGRGLQVAPFGGIQRRMGTNPLSIAFPNPEGDPYLLDMATSAIAANKARQAIDRGHAVASDLILDAEGHPSQDPRDLIERDGMLRPLGGSQGHKGYGLGVMVDFFSGILGGAGTAIVHDGLLNNGTFLITIDPGAFVDAKTYADQARALAKYLQATRTPPGAPPVMMPGEFESRNRRARMESGIALEEPVWKGIRKVLAELKVAEPQPIA
jgi:uncharacterized oxidoreductase